MIEKTGTYPGNFIPHGKGTLIYENGDKYEGDFFEGIRSGEGTLIQRNGTTKKGRWEADKLFGLGVETLKDGGYYNGHFVNGIKEG